MGDIEDAETIAAFLDGDRGAFDRLVLKYRQQVYRLCFRFTGNHHDADDQAQEVFLRAFGALPRFRSEARFSTWLYRIAVNACLNWAARRGALVEQLTEDVADPGQGQAESLLRAERSEALRHAVEKLPARQRITLVLRVYHGLSYREIAEALGSPVGTVKANVFFALENLRKLLGAMGESLV